MNRRALPIIAAVLLAAWLGVALFFSAVVAPAAFRTAGNVSAAGALVRATLPAVFCTGIVAGLIAVWLGAAGVASVARTARIACGVCIAACCAICQFVAVPRIDELRARVTTPIETLAPGDPTRVAFDHLHALSVTLLGGAMLLAVAAIVLLIRSGLASAVSPE